MIVNLSLEKSDVVLSANERPLGASADYSLEAYREFLHRKECIAKDQGLQFEPGDVHPLLKPHQVDSVLWAVRGGRRAIFAAFGLGKTFMQLEILRLILERHEGYGLIVAPLGVRTEFMRDAAKLGIPIRFIRRWEEIGEADSSSPAAPRNDTVDGAEPRIFLTNYETIRDGKLDPSRFTVTSLDEAAVLRSFGGTKTYREFMRLFETVKYRFVATATPDPNDFIELLAYAAYLGIMDVSQAKTRFFKRDSTKADHLTLHPHKEEEFWLVWVPSWALFLQRPSDLGHSDEGYDLPPLKVHYHEIETAGFSEKQVLRSEDDRGHGFAGLTEAARIKRETLKLRVKKATEIIAAEPNENFLLWHDLEAERAAIEKAIPYAATVYGSQEMDEREQVIVKFSDGEIQYLASKPVMLGAGVNFQRHCARAVFVGVGYKFNDFIQAVHRIHRFLQPREVEIHLVYADAERSILEVLKDKWKRYEERSKLMSDIIRQYGLSQQSMIQSLVRSIGCQRLEVSGERYQLVNNDAVEEVHRMADNSAGLIMTSIPFSTQYEYSPSYNDFGHTESNDHFWRQMDFLTPHLLRVLQPGRIAAIHVKDRIIPGGITGLGFQEVYPFHMDATRHFKKHGFAFMGMKTIVTDVVRENNQTYRLGWTEQCKDGTRMGVGMSEYLLLLRKPTSDPSNGYADLPVVKQKDRYTRSRWQIDAHGFTRSDGDRPLEPEEIESLPHDQIFRLFRDYSLNSVYDFEYHVRLGEALEAKQRLPVTFMLLQPQSWHPEVWTDITRMRTLNGLQAQKGKQMHLCPLQFDIAERVIAQMSMPGETVLDPFGGLMTVPLTAVKLGRVGIGIELNHSYFLDGCAYVEAAARNFQMPSLFSTTEPAPDSAPAEPTTASLYDPLNSPSNASI